MRISGQIEAIGVVNEAVEDGICMRGIWESLKPLTYRDLGSNQSRDTPKAIFEDLEQVAGFGNRNGVAHPFVEDEHVDLCQGAQ